MKSRRAKATIVATLVGLGGLAGVAIETNHGLPAAKVATTSGREIVTGASGATGVPASAPSSAANTERAPIVTRASGGGVGPAQVRAVED